jgi:hypothetical protein
MRTNIQSIRLSLAALMAAALSICLSASPAAASNLAASNDGLLTCPLGTQTTTYDPPLGPTTQHVDVHVTGSVSGCLPNSQNITGGQFEADAEGDLNCLIGGNSEGLFTFEWNTGQTSKVTYPEISITLRPLGQTIVVQTGQVISGPYAGGTMILQTTLLNLDLLSCLQGNVDAVGGPTEVIFTDL